MVVLTATQRLQFHKGFTLADAGRLVDYFHRLGISHLYASPLLTARPGSMHGYDVVDPTRINPELGGEAALRKLVAALRQRGMGLILDIVSNHMAVGGDSNPWWLDVLEWGQRSPYANFFDIVWDSHDPGLEGLLLVPFLGSDYGDALKSGQLALAFDADQGAFYARHYEHRFPINPHNYAELLGSTEHPRLRELASEFATLKGRADAREQALELRKKLLEELRDPAAKQAIETMLHLYDGRDEKGFLRLHALLQRQSYRLSSWRTAADDINWRRFFDVNELAGLRVELPEVFEATHAKIFQLIAEGLIDGLRIDHVDGLADPRGYCRRLRRRVDSLLRERPSAAHLAHFPIYVEKILGPGEHLHRDWGVDGTSGYEFMNQVSLVLQDPAGEAPLKRLWTASTGRTDDFMVEARAARRLVLSTALAGDFETVAQTLLLIARSDVMTRDITLGAIRRALIELIVHFPVYRAYVGPYGFSGQDRVFFQQAVEGAKTTLAEGDWPLLERLADWLGQEPIRHLPLNLRPLRRYACARFQQLTSPAAAKAVEDTAFYRSAVSLARNDVGFDPQVFAAGPAAFHRHNQDLARHFPLNMLTTATHDHKRGEDSRARLAVLSERAEWYTLQVRRWMELAAPLRQQREGLSLPAPVDEVLLYQTLIGSWPLSVDGQNDYSSWPEAEQRAFAERLDGWQTKALREAKLYTTWTNPDEEYESACRNFLHGLLKQDALRQALASTVSELAAAGALNSLTQTTLRLMCPGIPDLYQGNEYWDFSLVDPDNRRPVDYPLRQSSLAEEKTTECLLESWQDGYIKQYLLSRLLLLRRQKAELFCEGSYLPLEVKGTQAERVLAFARLRGDDGVIVVAPRLASGLLGDGSKPLVPGEDWQDTEVLLPEGYEARQFIGLFPPHEAPLEEGRLKLKRVLAQFPVNILYL